MATKKQNRKQKAIFLDRDGTVVKFFDILRKDDVKLLPGVTGALRRFRDAGYLLVLITNQPAIAKNLITEEETKIVNDLVIQRIAAGGVEIDACYVCPHHPEGIVEIYRKKCFCRKPRAGMLKRAARDLNILLEESIMIGDAKVDVVAGKRAGTKTVQVKTGPGNRRDKEFEHELPDAVAENLVAAAEIILTKF